MYNFKKRFEENYNNKNLIEHNDSLLLGISGGPDSLTMLDLFYKIKDKYNLKLTVFHLNHSFRKEADNEAKFVKKICNQRNIEHIIKKFDVPDYVKTNNLSPEEGAREVRFKFLKDIYDKRNIDKICLAHNKDDNVETVLFNIFRGSGTRGLLGIKDSISLYGMKIIHPLLLFYRSEILDYCEINDLSPVFDPSNDSNLYSRNRIRNNILPMIEKQINPNVKKSVIRLSDIIMEDYDFIDKHAKNSLKKVLIEKNSKRYVFNLDKTKDLHPAIIKRIINTVLVDIKGNIDNFYYKHYNYIIEFIKNNKTGDLLELPDDIKLKISYNKLLVFKGTLDIDKSFEKSIDSEGSFNLPFEQGINFEIINKKIDWRNYNENNICLVDFNKVIFPLKVRNRRDGDKFIPLGMNGHKKVKDFFIDQKVPDYLRDKIPILFNGDGKLIWICGYRMDDRFKLKKSSKKILLIKYHKED
jgi:tRNA(Ile)-lysidine synthase